MSWLLSWLWWTLLPVRKRLAVDNFRHAFPDRDPTELRRFMAETIRGYLWLLRGKRVPIEGVEHAAGALLLAGHTAAWDLVLISGAEQTPSTVFVKPPSNRLAAWLIRRLRARTGAELLPPRGSKDAAYDALSRGRTVVFLLDQRHNQGIPVPFFGRPAWTSAAFAAMAHRSRAPVVGLWQWWEDGELRARVEPLDIEIPDDRDQAIAEITAWTQRWYEEQIRTAPRSWLWLHDRWKVPGA